MSAKAPTIAQMRATYETLFSTMVIKPAALTQAHATALRLLKNIDRYRAVEKLTGVPAIFVMATDERESGGKLRYLGNGQSLSQKTTVVPKGRGPFPEPNAFEKGAVDALTIQGYIHETDWSVAHIAFDEEGFNGWGYYFHGLHSPYLWGGTNHQQAGKYVADGDFDKTKWDTQLGCMVVIKVLMDMEPSLALHPHEDAPAPVQPPLPLPVPKPPVIVHDYPVPVPAGTQVTPGQAKSIGLGVAIAAALAAFWQHIVAALHHFLPFLF